MNFLQKEIKEAQKELTKILENEKDKIDQLFLITIQSHFETFYNINSTLKNKIIENMVPLENGGNNFKELIQENILKLIVKNQEKVMDNTHNPVNYYKSLIEIENSIKEIKDNKNNILDYKKELLYFIEKEYINKSYQILKEIDTEYNLILKLMDNYYKYLFE